MGLHRLVVVGASLAGLRAVEAARRAGFAGSIVLVGDETHLPYDRPPLSKEFLATDAVAVPHFPGVAELADALGVELRLGAPATALDLGARAVTADTEIPYDALLVATGVRARTLPGQERLAGVHSLRTVEDATAIRTAIHAGGRIVIIGGGFIGSEVASAALAHGRPATIVEAAPAPLARSVGPVAGARLGELHARFGTELRCGVGVAELQGDGHVEAVLLADGTRLEADLVVVGVGADPATGWLEHAGLTLDDGVVCDERLQAADGVWAAGDVARWRSLEFDTLLRLEHWTNAAEQAGHAVRNLLDPAAATPYHHVPYFWSDWYGQRIQFVGLAVGEPALVLGGWDEDAFVALFRSGERLSGALTLNRRGDIMKYRNLIASKASWDEALAFAASRQRPAGSETRSAS